jgi:hypothetical protein
LLNYQKTVLTTYLRNPAIHVKSSRNPKLPGGPFVNIPEECAGDIECLLKAMAQDLLLKQLEINKFIAAAQRKGINVQMLYRKKDLFYGMVDVDRQRHVNKA